MLKNNVIMIVDDDEDDRDFFCEAVENINLELKCLHVENGEKALQYLQDVEHIMPDYIFLDLNMPRLDGKECLVAIKKIDHLKEVPIIIYSTSTHPSDKEQTFQLGANGFIHKHTEFNSLCKELKKWIE